MKVRLDNADHRGKEFHSRVGKVTRAEKVTLNDRANSIRSNLEMIGYIFLHLKAT